MSRIKLIGGYAIVLTITSIFGAMFAFTLSFTLLGRIDNIPLAVIANTIIGGQFLWYLYKLSKIARARRAR